MHYFNHALASEHPRPRLIFLISFALCAALLAGCTPRQKGAAEQGFYATGIAAFSVGVNPPLSLASSGTLSGTVPSDMNINPHAGFTYALFTDGDEGAISRHAHAIFSELERESWRWERESWAKTESIFYSKHSAGGKNWTVQIFPLTATGDWFSALWEQNGRAVPEFWLAKRWSARPEDEIRLVVEYREPAPACMLERLGEAETARRTDKNAPMLRGRSLEANSHEALEAFSKRADAAIDLNGLARLPEKPLQRLTTRPDCSPNMGKLVGRAEYIDYKIDAAP